MCSSDLAFWRFGVTDHGGAGMRLQTFCERRYEFRVLVDPIATYNFQTLPEQPFISIVPGMPKTWVAVIPSTVTRGDPFSLKIKAEDHWGNPTNKAATRLKVKSNRTIKTLPDFIEVKTGDFATIISDIIVSIIGPLEISLYAPDGSLLATCNPAFVSETPYFKSYWGDLHGQDRKSVV